jgi:hypothetical protein
MKYIVRGKLVYLSAEACKSLRIIGNKYPDKRTGKPLSYNKSVLFLLKMLEPGLFLAENVKENIKKFEEEGNAC